MTASDQAPQPIDVAILGGGISGLCLSIALQHHPSVHVTIYEAVAEFSEIGAGIGFGPNAVSAFNLISPDVAAAFEKLACGNAWPEYKDTWFQVRYGQGPQADQVIIDIPNLGRHGFVHRAHFLHELVQLVPTGTVQFGKRLTRIGESAVGPTNLFFEDGTTATADCVVGADGMHSVVREHVLGADHLSRKAIPTDCVAYRALVPMDVAAAAIGDEKARNSMIYAGDGAYILTYPVDGGNTLNVVAIDDAARPWDGPTMRPVAYAKIAARFAAWGPAARAVIALFDTGPCFENMLWEHPPTPAYARGTAVLVGDAAHTTTPFQAQGAAQAVEDSLLLARLLAAARGPAHLPAALRAFDAVRRPRGERLVATSRDAGRLFAFALPGVGADVHAMRADLGDRMRWMWCEDVPGAVERAVGLFHEYVAAEREGKRGKVG